MKSVAEAYEAYPLTSDNRYNCEYNAKRVGFRQGYDKTVEAAIKYCLENLI